MSLLNLKKFGSLAACVSLCAFIAVQGCSSDDKQAAPGTGGKSSSAGSAGSNKAGSESKGGSSNNNNGGSAGVPDVEETGGVAGEVGAGGEGGEGGEAPVDPGCLGKDDCYKCEPKTNSQFLNACVDGGCPASFDNSTLSKLNLVGTL